MALNGFKDEEMKEASWVAQSVAGASAYLHGVDYDRKKFGEELEKAVRHIRRTGRKVA